MGQKPIEGSNPSLSANSLECAGRQGCAHLAEGIGRLRRETPARSDGGPEAERRDEARSAEQSLPLRQDYVVSLINAPVAQLDRAPGYEPGGREFESLRARH